MKILGIIAEYNPFHEGHAYHIRQAKKLTKADFVVVIMSGSFTQNGNIAILNKFNRANIAILSGADLVIELPTIYSTSSSQDFAKGAVYLLNSLGIVDFICFGSEEKEIANLESIADFLLENELQLMTQIKSELKTGISYAKARSQILEKYLLPEQSKLLNQSNVILGIEYIKELKRIQSSITPYAIFRETKKSNSLQYESSTNIRQHLWQNNKTKDKGIEKLSDFIPEHTKNALFSNTLLFNEDIFPLLKYKIISSSTQYLSTICEVTEGLEYKLKKEITQVHHYEDFVQALKSKRYQRSKIKRMLLAILLDITKENKEYLLAQNVAYAHVLKVSQNGKALLSLLSKKSRIPILTTYKNLDVAPPILNSTQLDIYASNIVSTLEKQPLYQDNTNPIL